MVVSSLSNTEQLTGELRAWVDEALAGTNLVFDLPDDPPSADEGVSLFLLGLDPRLAARRATPPPLQIGFRYLVSTWAGTAERSHAMLADLLFAAMTRPALSVGGEAAPPSLWGAFGLRPRASFVLEATLDRARPRPDARLVTHPLGVAMPETADWRGRIVAAGTPAVPIAGATVELPDRNLRVRTGPDGRFRLPWLRPDEAGVRLHVETRGQTREAALPLDGSVRLDFEGFSLDLGHEPEG